MGRLRWLWVGVMVGVAVPLRGGGPMENGEGFPRVWLNISMPSYTGAFLYHSFRRTIWDAVWGSPYLSFRVERDEEGRGVEFGVSSIQWHYYTVRWHPEDRLERSGTYHFIFHIRHRFPVVHWGGWRLTGMLGGNGRAGIGVYHLRPVGLFSIGGSVGVELDRLVWRGRFRLRGWVFRYDFPVTFSREPLFLPHLWELGVGVGIPLRRVE